MRRPLPGFVRGALSLSLAVALVAPQAVEARPASAGVAHTETEAARQLGLSADVQRLVHWVLAREDNRGGPFAVIDKKAAMVHLFDRVGVRVGSSPVLLGLARGDHSVPGIGERKMSEIRPEERTTPAGRFAAEPGRNLQGEDIVWIDYDAAISMHRVRANNTAERRLERLATPTPADNRISYGCVNVPAAFYDAHIRPALGTGRGMVYVLPEVRGASEVFGMDEAAAAAQHAPPVASE